MANSEIITLVHSAGNKNNNNKKKTKICRAAGQIACQATGNSPGALDGQSAPARVWSEGPTTENIWLDDCSEFVEQHMDPFDESAEQWATYIERFEQFVSANDILDEKWVTVLLSVMGSSTYGLLWSLVAPEKPGAKLYNDIVTVLKEHFSPEPIVIAERFRFHNRSQHETETVEQYVTVLKKAEWTLWIWDAFGRCFVRSFCVWTENRVHTETATHGSSAHIPKGSGDCSVYGNSRKRISTVKWLFER